ncbi:TetR/AcrR family transcriptional regulator [Streptomyces sp. NPDC001020]
MPRAGLSPDAVRAAAIAVLDAGGPQALTLARVAAHTGVAVPSLYNHVDGLTGLRRMVAIQVMGELADRVAEAVQGRSRDDAVSALMFAYRGYAVEHPRRYEAIPQALGDDAGLRTAGDRVLQPILAALRGYDLPDQQIIHAARCVRAAAHGFATLQAGGGFQFSEDLDTSYTALIRLVTDGLAHWK